MIKLHMDDRRDCALLGQLGLQENPHFAVGTVVSKTLGSLLQDVGAAQESPSLVLTIRVVLR